MSAHTNGSSLYGRKAVVKLATFSWSERIKVKKESPSKGESGAHVLVRSLLTFRNGRVVWGGSSGNLLVHA